ncbi:ATPase, T2SS/T4P/T4SS family [Porticoccus sp. W117]|uniref:GspE/PulE family protein n=1 Tax=Porticoccus sp. W117 TaxID=3054777 RepID=UPI00259405A3|nr:type II/IV secretion system protein [Porticoccus sp. W117]MDM3872298.1 ATPase, T2SS/T4P/T4SS family [Porticoccus sp. W117]
MVEVTVQDRRLELRPLLAELQGQGLLSQECVNLVSGSTRSREEALQHPLIYIAKQQLEGCGDMSGRVLDLDRLTHWLAEQTGMPVVHIDPLKIQVSAVTEVMSFAFAKRHGILCVDVLGDELVIATEEPYASSWVEGLEQVTRKTVRRVLANPADIHKYRMEFYTLARSISGADKQPGASSVVTNVEQLMELGKAASPDAQDQHIVAIVDWLLQYAFEQRASDIHIEPRREKGKIRFRIDGVLHLVYEMPLQIMIAMTSRLKVLGRMNVAEKRKPQDGRIKTMSPDNGEVELRLSTLPTAFGEKLVMRIFDPDVLLRNFAELGLVGEDSKRWQQMVERPHGIVLVTGPTGSGKTTTLYSSLKQLATESVNVSTVEDPIEMVVDNFNQTQVHHKIDLDFAAGIRTLMRQDPDIIMVGEIRDRETADMATQAALTGHLVISTLHTNDAPTAITRLLDIGVPAHLIRATLNGVMAQRLVRTLCPHCKETTELEQDAWQQLVRPWKVAPPKAVYRPVGCLECRGTGYLGRQGIYEILPLSDSLRPLVKDDGDIEHLRVQAMKEGMRTLRLSGAQKVAAGLTSITEVMRVAPDSGK